MNCVECRDQFVALSEELLEAADRQQCVAHLASCSACRAEFKAITRLQQQLLAHGQSAAGASIVAAVMRRVSERESSKKETIMSIILKHRWGFGLSAATGMVAMAIGLFIAFSPRAFGVEQVINAYNKIRYLHVKSFSPQAVQPNEYWIQCNDQGLVEKARYDLPETEDGEKLISWTPEKAEIWFKSKHGFLILQTKRIAPMMQNLLDASQPQLVMKRLKADEQVGKVEVQTKAAQGSQTNSLIIVTHQNKPQKEIYFVDPKTDLITRIEYFHLKGTNEVLKSHLEFSDYNVPIDSKMFSLQGQLPPDVSVADQLSQVTGVAQGSLTDVQAAAETVRQFFQALVDKDYKEAGLIYGGELEADFKQQFGAYTVVRIISVGPAEIQPNWMPRGYRVPSKLEIIDPAGHKYMSEPGPYVRPGDDESHPDRWHITGGVSLGEGQGMGMGSVVPVLSDNKKYAAMTAEETARAFFEACSSNDWAEATKFMPYLNEPAKRNLGGLKLISIGKSFTADEYPGGKVPKGYPGRFVPYEIQLPAQEFYIRVANTNDAKRYVLMGLYDSNFKQQEDFKWTGQPEVLPDNDNYSRMSAMEVVQAYFNAQAKLDWAEMRKFTSEYDVENTKGQVRMAEQAGINPQQVMPQFEVGQVTWSPDRSACFVKCRMFQTKKWNLAVRNDNPAHRWQVDGGI